MPILINYNYVSIHTINYNNGNINAVYALPQASRLYVIVNGTTGHPVYIGTADNVQNRFTPRLEAMRELGFNQNALNPIQVLVIQTQVNGVNTTPGNTGIAGGIDVEHLLIRTYMGHLNLPVRNIQKTAAFQNASGQRIDWTLTNNAGIVNFGGPYAYHLNNGTQL